MRYVFLALACGLLIGAATPIGSATGADCTTVTNTHYEHGTVCDQGPDDYVIDRITNSGSTGYVCIQGEAVDNVAYFTYGNQCQSLDEDVTGEYTVVATRVNYTPISYWRTDVSFGYPGCDTSSNPSATQHSHGSSHFQVCE